jgi:acetylornithine deacetylase/succinyl-diaminopimelate desuccinylase-like protein
MTGDPVLAAKKKRHRNERIAATLLVLLLAGATVYIIRMERISERELRTDKRLVPKSTPLTPEIKLLQEYVRIDTSTPEGVARGARWLAAQLEEKGIKPEIIESAPGRLNVYARIRGRSRGQGLVLFNHIDVVPPNGEWSLPPFEARIGLNMMWGRGTLDMKAMALCQLFAFTAIAQSADAPEHDLVFLATADEETGSQFGMQWLIQNRPDVFADIRYGITEGGITEMMSEDMTYFGIEVNGKQLVHLTLEGTDRESLERARIALEPAMFPREPQRILPIVRRFFSDVAPARIAFRKPLADIDGTIARGDFWHLPVTYRDLTQDSLWVSAPFESDGRWRMTVRMVNLPDERPDDRIRWLETVVAPYRTHVAQVHEKQGPVPSSDPDSVVFQILAKRASEEYSVPSGVVVLYRAMTDSRFLRQHGVDCYGVCPFPVDFYQSNTIHRPHERIDLDGFLRGIEYMDGVVRDWAATP